LLRAPVTDAQTFGALVDEANLGVTDLGLARESGERGACGGVGREHLWGSKGVAQMVGSW
jgi:hypothetical protein